MLAKGADISWRFFWTNRCVSQAPGDGQILITRILLLPIWPYCFADNALLGKKDNLLYKFERADETTWKSWETFDLKRKLAKVQPGEFVVIEYLGSDGPGKMKKFKVGVMEEGEPLDE